MASDPLAKMAPRVLAAGLVLAAFASCGRPREAPVVIEGSSMSPALWGRRIAWNCPDCGAESWSAAESWPDDDRLGCAACGRVAVAARGRELEGQRATLAVSGDSTPLTRWSIVAFHREGIRASEVKRLVALSGESLALRDGDVWIDGRRLEKTWREFQSLAVLVRDARFRSRSGGNGWEVARSESGVVEMRYRPQDLIAAWRDPAANTDDAPASQPRWLDDHAENPSLSRRWHDVADIVVEMPLPEASGRSLAAASRRRCVLDSHRGRLELRWSAANNEVEGLWNGQPLIPARVPWASPDDQRAIGRDRCWWGVLDGRAVILAGSLSWQAELPEAPSSPPTLAAGIEIELEGPVDESGIRIWRDAHYFHPLGESWSLILGPAEFGVLGDNQPLAEDSRQFGPVHQRWILGVVESLKR